MGVHVAVIRQREKICVFAWKQTRRPEIEVKVTGLQAIAKHVLICNKLPPYTNRLRRRDSTQDRVWGQRQCTLSLKFISPIQFVTTTIVILSKKPKLW